MRTLIDPASVFFSYDTEIESDVIIEPNVFFGRGVKIRRGARIHAFCHFEGTEVGENAEISRRDGRTSDPMSDALRSKSTCASIGGFA